MAVLGLLRSTLPVDANRQKRAFGAVLRRVRAAAGLTQEALAHAASLSTTFISLVENGHKAPTILVVQQLAKALGVTASALLADWERELARTRKK